MSDPQGEPAPGRPGDRTGDQEGDGTGDRTWTREPTSARDLMLDRASLRALAHPVRVRIVGLLRREGSSTASRLADRLGLNSGATSYHLRQLAQAGLVVEDPDRGNNRDRWWQAAYRSTYFDTAAYEADPDAAMAYLGGVAAAQAERIMSAVATLPGIPTEWRDVSELSDYSLRLTVEEAEQLLRELTDVIARYRRDDEEAGGVPQGAERFVVQLQSMLEPGPAGGSGDGADR